MRRKIDTALLVFFNGRSNAGGAERMVLYLDEWLRSRDIKTQIIDETYLLQTALGKPFSRIFRYRHFQKRRPIYMARFTSAWLWMNKKSSQLTISNGESTPFFPVDVVINNGCYHAMELDYGRQSPKLSRIARLQKSGCSICGMITTVTEKVKQDLLRYYKLDPEKIFLVSNRVDTDYFTPLPRESKDHKTLLYIGRLEPGKGLTQLLRVAWIIEKNESWRFLIGCNNPMNSELFRDLNHTSVKVGLDLQNINAEAYSKADLVFSPSLSESFGMVTIEALASGVPVVGTPVGILQELNERKFPGAFLFMELADEELIPFFEKLVREFEAVDRMQVHKMIREEFGIESYRKRLDNIIGKKYLTN